MKKTNWKKALLALTMAATTMLSAVGCGSRGAGGASGADNVDIDTTKSQLYLKYYNGGVNRVWIDDVISQFERDYAEVEFETGKKGVQIIKDFDKSGISASAIEKNPNQVFMLVGVEYYDYASNGVMMDISDVVQNGAALSPNQKEEKTIESKFRESQKSFYQLDRGNGKKYYALPFFESFMNLIYNVSVFEDKKLYFAQGKDGETETWSDADLKSSKVEDLFVKRANAPKSLGPDGKTGEIDGVNYSADDGLPATYKDFQALLTCMVRRNVIPFIWNATSTDYLTGIANEAWMNNEGAEQFMLNMSFEGTAKNLVALDDKGNVQYNEDGSVKMRGATEITPSNAYELHAQKGKLDAIEFVKMMMGSSDYRYRESFKMDFRATQRYFLNGNVDGLTGGKDIAMMVEGTWWNSEARSDYASEEDRHSEDRKFAILPLPKSDISKVGEKNTKVSERQTLIFINNFCADYAVPIAKEFVSYLHSDRVMNIFSKDTDMLRALNYELTEDTLQGMSYFGRSAYEFATSANTDVIEWLPTSNTTKKNGTLLDWASYAFSTATGGKNPYLFYFEESNAKVSPATYFKDIYNNYKNSWKIS
jgi:hypothetical protein